MRSDIMYCPFHEKITLSFDFEQNLVFCVMCRKPYSFSEFSELLNELAVVKMAALSEGGGDAYG